MKIFLFAIALLASLVCNAQQDPIYSQYMFNMLTVNPAYAGSRNVLSTVALHRQQWANNVPGAPRTSTLTADMPVMDKKVGVGLSLVHDRIGRFNTSNVNVYAAYRLKVDREGILSMGITGGVSRFHADLSSIRINPQGTSEDLFLDYSEVLPMVGAGFFYNRDKWYMGLSSPNLLSTYEKLEDSEDVQIIRDFQHLYFTGGYVFQVSNEVVLKPSFMLRGAIGAPVSVDLNANVWFHNLLGVGVSYRIDNAVIPMLEVQATDQFRFGYALDYTLSDFENQKGNTPLTHEFLLRYEFGFKKDKILSPRYF